MGSIVNEASLRAIVINGLRPQEQQQVRISGEPHHHLRVSRVRPGEKILLILGEGRSALSELIHIEKNEALLNILSYKNSPRSYDIEVCLGLLKKDAMEEVAKLVTELGVKKVTPVLTQYSQRTSQQFKRWNKIVEQAQQQSNNLYRPILSDVVELEKFLCGLNKSEVCSYLLSSLPGEMNLISSLPANKPSCLFIGPEGGFSSNEEEMIQRTVHASKVHLPMPIMRAPTAISVGVGHLISGLKFV